MSNLCKIGVPMDHAQNEKPFILRNCKTRTKGIQKSASTELHEWSENVVNVKNRQILKENCEFLSVIWVINESSQYTLELFLILLPFIACFYHFLFWRYLNSSITSFSSYILLPFPNSNDLNSRRWSKGQNKFGVQ